MFKGTQKFPQGVFSKKIAALGGQENAYTSTDYTAYFEQLSAQYLATSFELESDRMQNLTFNPDEFKKEMQVIQEERRLRTDDNPQALTYERFMAAAHLASPYHHPVIGWMSDIEKLTLKDIQAWYQSYYAPNNATLVVAGDIKPQEVFKLARKYFGSIKPKTLPTRKAQTEPPRLGKKAVEVHAPAQIPMLMMGYTVPSLVANNPNHPSDPFALQVLAGVLDAGDTGRLVKNLVRGQQIASDVEVSYNLFARYQTQFMIYGMPSPNKSTTDLEKGILKQIQKLKQTPLSEKELQRIKTQIIAQKVFERDSIFSQAMEIGMLETLGLGWQTSEAYINRIKAVTPEEIQSVAKRYFNEPNLTLAKLVPSKPSPQVTKDPR